MKLVKPSRLGMLVRMIEHDHKPRMIIGVLAAFRLSEPKRLVADVELWPVATVALEGEDGVLDEAMAKTRGEVLVTGRCFPGRETPQPVSFVRVKVGPVDKRLAVLGDRFWKHGVPTEPKPFDEMPVDWAHAFGGAEFERNPKGKGHAPIEIGGERVHPLPNIEDARRLINAPGDRPEPAGFGGRSLTWPQRKSKFGTYGHDWLKTRAFGFAADMDPTLFNLASEDQWLPGYFSGDETFLVENMHPKHRRIEGTLPPLAVRVLATLDDPASSPGGERLLEVQTRIDTLRLFPAEDMGVLIFRGALETREDDGADVKEVLLACEDRSQPRPMAHYREELLTRRDHEEAGLRALSDRALAPQVELGWAASSLMAEVKDIPRAEHIRQHIMMERKEREVAEARARLVASGLDPKDFSLDPPAEGVPEVDTNDQDAVIAFIREQREKNQTLEEQYNQKKKEMIDNARALFAEQGEDFDAAVQEAKKKSAGPPKFNAERQLSQMRELLAISREHGQPVALLEQLVDDPAYQQELREAQQRLEDLYRIGAQHGEPVDRLDEAASQMFRAELEVAHHNAIRLDARDMSGADLSQMNLSGMDLSGAFLEGVNLTGSDLSGANLEGAVLAHAELHGTKLVGASLKGANLGGARFVEADLTGASLEKCVLARASIERSSLRGVSFGSASIMEVTFGPDVDFGQATAELTVFLKLDLRSVRLAGVRFHKCAFVECNLTGADLSGADLSATVLLTCPADRARLKGAVLAGTQFVVGTSLAEADMSGARLSNASLRGLDLRRANLRGAALDCADLSLSKLEGADLTGVAARQAMLIGTDLTRAKLCGADLLSALLTKAKLFGADLTGANLFSADLAKIHTDRDTRLGGVNMGRARLHPRAPDGP